MRRENVIQDKYERLSAATEDMITAELCRRSLFIFIQEFWHVIVPNEPKWNWHIPLVCEELEKVARAVARGEAKPYDLIINIPPGTTKSLTCTIFWPVWCWINWPWMRFITASYSAPLSLEHAEKSRDIVRSEKFKRLFPNIDLKRDKDAKGNFQIITYGYNEDGASVMMLGGNRFSTSVGGTVTGYHGDILIVDDPLNPQQAASEAELKSTNYWMSQTLPTRKTDKEVTPTVLIMQRLHQGDPTGALLEKAKKTKGIKIRHICLPGEIRTQRNAEEEARKTGKELDKTGFVNPPHLAAHYLNDLLDPVRLPWSVLGELKALLGQYGFSGQILQKPVPPGGGMFQVDRFIIIDTLPSPVNFKRFVRYWDKAGSEDAGAYTVGVKMGELKNGKYIILDVKRGQWSTEVREAIMRATAEADGIETEIWIEQEPGSGGKESADNTVKNLRGFAVHKDRPTGKKVYRADPYSVQVNAMNVMMLAGKWNHEYVEEHRFFPFSTYKDQVDAGAGAFNVLAGQIQGVMFTRAKHVLHSG